MKYLSLGQQKILFVLALLILALTYYKFYYRPASPPEEVYNEIVVEVLGEVKKPGVYIFKDPPTLIEAVEKAGGLKENAPLDQGVFSEIVETGALINVVKENSIIPPTPPLTKSVRLEAEGGEGGIFEKEGSRDTTQNVIKIKLGRMNASKLLAFSIPLDLNRVSVEDLCLIPGIGESLAREIVTTREKKRRFRSIEELKSIKGIGEKKFDSLKSFFIVRL